MKKLILWGLALIVVIGGSAFLYQRLTSGTKAPAADSRAPEDENGEKIKAPDFTVYDKDGNETALSSFIGKPILINFWASWCGPCKSEMPDLSTVYKEYKDDVVFLFVNMTDGSRETEATASAYIEEEGYDFPVYFDTAQNAAAVYGVTSIPSTVFIDAEGYIAAGYRGALDLDGFRDNLDAISSSEPTAASDLGTACFGCSIEPNGSCT